MNQLQQKSLKKKQHQRVSNYLESTDCSSEDKRPISGQGLQEANTIPTERRELSVKTSQLIVQ